MEVFFLSSKMFLVCQTWSECPYYNYSGGNRESGRKREWKGKDGSEIRKAVVLLFICLNISVQFSFLHIKLTFNSSFCQIDWEKSCLSLCVCLRESSIKKTVEEVPGSLFSLENKLARHYTAKHKIYVLLSLFIYK